jgi:hypothetical protein
MTDHREKMIKEAARLRGLGFYTQAVQCYRNILSDGSDLEVSLELSGTLMEQGCVRASLETITDAIKGLAENEDTDPDDALIPLARMFKENATVSRTGRWSPSLEIVVSLYNNHLRDIPVERFEKRRVSHVQHHMHFISFRSFPFKSGPMTRKRYAMKSFL